MAKIKYLPQTGKLNSKMRRYLARGKLIELKRAEALIAKETDPSVVADPYKPIEVPNGTLTATDRALMSGALPRDCEPKDNAPKDDIMNRVVNHAHQRNPNKKW